MKLSTTMVVIPFLILGLILSSGCSAKTETPVPVNPNRLPTLPTFPTRTPSPLLATAMQKMNQTAPTEIPTEEQAPQPGQEEYPTRSAMEYPDSTTSNADTQPNPVQTVTIYLVVLEGNQPGVEMIGCGDQLMAVVLPITPTTGVLRAALTKLLSIREAYYGESGLYHALYQSDLTVERIELENGLARVYLSGQLITGGVCDIPRIQAQLETTALQFSTVNQVQFYINGESLEEVLSLKD